jgi:hypothetical protein
MEEEKPNPWKLTPWQRFQEGVMNFFLYIAFLGLLLCSFLGFWPCN